MYTLLVVDDEPVERDGIKFLINKFNFGLNVLEAENGKKALECLQSNHVDILFTDIKMPFMDGLELAKQARESDPYLKIIIFSAYGEFDFAKEAIRNNVQNYVLKPVDPDEFRDVVSKMVKMCSDEAFEREKGSRLLEGYRKALAYEKEELLTSLLSGATVDDVFLQRLHVAGINFEGKNTVMMFIDIKERFFDTRDDEFSTLLKSILDIEFDYINLNEYQSIVFLKGLDICSERYRLEKIGDNIRDILHESYKVRICLVFGKTVKNTCDFLEEYRNIERTIDNSFFFQDSVIFFTTDDFSYNAGSIGLIDKITDEINAAIDSYDSTYAVRSLEQLFNTFRADINLSPVYVKYVCAEIGKKVISKIHNKSGESFKFYVDKIFAENNMIILRDDMIMLFSGLIREEQHETGEAGKKVIARVMEIIHQEYMRDIGLEYIADKVYLTPTYLSYLFKKETGQSLLKYIIAFRLSKAKELLDNTNMRIIDICEKVGYSKLSYFCAIFKNNYGITPAKYREREGAN